MSTLLALCALAATGCAGKPPAPPPPPPPASIDGTLQASASVNPNVSQRPSPLLIRIYELKAADSFNSADFIALYQRDQAELGTDMTSREELMLQPGESRPWTRTLKPDTRFIAVFAAFRDTERAQWRAVMAVRASGKQHLLIRADGVTLTISP